MIWFGLEQKVQHGIDLLMLILQLATVSTSPCYLIPDSSTLFTLLWDLPSSKSTEFVTPTKYFKWQHKSHRRCGHMPFLLYTMFYKPFFWEMLATKWLLSDLNHSESSNSNLAKPKASACPKAPSIVGFLDQLIPRFCSTPNMPMGLARTKKSR